MRPTPMLSMLPLTLLAALLAGCGGSGSSGFDVSPLTEDAVIEEVLSGGDCLAAGDLTICPAAGPMGHIPGQPGPSPGEGRQVVLDVPASDSLVCAVSPRSDSCSFAVSFTVVGLPQGSTFRAATRAVSPAPGSWVIGGPALGDEAVRHAPLDAPASASAVQLAVLVFVDGADAAPGPVTSLAESGAAFAFVTGALEVVSVP